MGGVPFLWHVDSSVTFESKKNQEKEVRTVEVGVPVRILQITLRL